MAVADSPAVSHDDESIRRRRLLQKHRVDGPVEEAIRAEITSYLQRQADDEMDENPLVFRKTHVQFEHCAYDKHSSYIWRVTSFYIVLYCNT